eukprot:CAMPEP_0114114184 /NCGR_PEP_ID=MMETSP0043_2-20121206/3303_1 /TAXON_ID=464988 /ORGANISM="Hemiselmis andersenii, Strain CCMP644" /LENGTH=173 /DNA_ID=CAMNT_0001206369 /DNA_START=318 /DNA_END=840 /DNA_ORIENTATION=+
MVPPYQLSESSKLLILDLNLGGCQRVILELHLVVVAVGFILTGSFERAALGALLAGALSIPAAASAGDRANEAYSTPKNLDRNYQLRNAGVMTDVESSSMSGVRATGGSESGFDAKKKAAKFSRTMSDDSINKIDDLYGKIAGRGVLDKYKTSNKIGINPGFGGSSGIFNGNK